MGDGGPRDDGGGEGLDSFYSALLDDDPEALYEQAPCGYLSTTPQGTIVRVNGIFLRLTGWERTDLIGKRTFADLLTVGGRIYHETHYAPMLQMQGSAREIALDIVAADGRRLPVLVTSVVDRDEHGTPMVVRTAVFDATERRQYERELLRAKERAEESEARATVLARTLQQTLIPPAPPDIPGLEIAAAYRPAGAGDEVGGDFYDIFQTGADEWLVAIGDVCGKGVEAAVVTALARHTIRAAAIRHERLRDVLVTLNDVLLSHETERFCTVALARLRLCDGGWRMTTCLGGHPHPVLRRRGEPPTTIGKPGSLVGSFSTTSFHEDDVVLERGDTVVLYTDGVTEGRQGTDFFGEQRLNAAIASYAGTAATVTDGVLHELLQFQSGDPRDDIAIVVIAVP